MLEEKESVLRAAVLNSRLAGSFFESTKPEGPPAGQT